MCVLVCVGVCVCVVCELCECVCVCLRIAAPPAALIACPHTGHIELCLAAVGHLMSLMCNAQQKRLQEPKTSNL